MIALARRLRSIFRWRPWKRRSKPRTTPTVPPPGVAGAEPIWQRFELDRRDLILPFVNPTQGLSVGEVTFLDDGSVSLGGRIFETQVEIENYRMGQCIANRGFGAKQLLGIDRPDGESYYYSFQHDHWYRLVPVTGQQSIVWRTLSELVRQQGPFAFIVLVRQLAYGLIILGVSLAVSFGVFFLIACLKL